MTFLVYEEQLERFRSGRLKSMTVSLRPDQLLTAGDGVSFQEISLSRLGVVPAPLGDDKRFRARLSDTETGTQLVLAAPRSSDGSELRKAVATRSSSRTPATASRETSAARARRA